MDQNFGANKKIRLRAEKLDCKPKKLDCAPKFWMLGWVIGLWVEEAWMESQKIGLELKYLKSNQKIGLWVSVLDFGLKNWIVGQNIGW